MNIVLKKVELEKYVKEQVSSGRYGSPEDVVAAALSRQMQDEHHDDFAPGELDELLEEGEADIKSGDVLTLDEVREHFRQRSLEAQK